MVKLEVSDIAGSIRGRIREVEEQLKDHRALSDELELRILARVDVDLVLSAPARWSSLGCAC